MTSKELETKIKDLEIKITTLEQDLNNTIITFQNELTPIVVTWVKERLKYARESHPKIIQELGPENIAKFKNEIDQFLVSIPNIISQETSDSSEWPHNTSYPGIVYFDRTFSRVAGHLVLLLKKWSVFSCKEAPRTGYSKEWGQETVESGSGRGNNQTIYNWKYTPVSNLPSAKAIATKATDYKHLKRVLYHTKQELERARANEAWGE